jgi:hypothetical protein
VPAVAVTRLIGQTILVPDVEGARTGFARIGLAFGESKVEPERGLKATRARLGEGTFLELAAPLDAGGELATAVRHALEGRGEGMYTIHLGAGTASTATLYGTRLELAPESHLAAPADAGHADVEVGYRSVWNAAIAVHDLDQAVAGFEHVLDMPVSHRQDQPDWGLRTAMFRLPEGGYVELVDPIDPSQDAARRVARILEKAGEGPYMLVVQVDDVHAAHRALRTCGAALIGPTPIPPGTAWVPAGDQLWVHPRDAHGVFLELISFHPAAHSA